MKTAIWIVFATLGLAWVMGGYQELVPWPPRSVAIWLLDLYGAQNADDIGRVEVFYLLGISFIAVTVGTFTVRWLWKRRHKYGKVFVK